MPKSPNPLISRKLLDAAEQLLESGSEAAVTLRRLSEKTGIAVTTIYERFHDRQGLMTALGQHVGEKENNKLANARSVTEIFDHYLRFARASPHRYKLVVDTFARRLKDGITPPSIELLKRALARQLGGTPEQYEERALGIIQLLIGAATAIRVGEQHRDIQAKALRAAKSALRLLLTPPEARKRGKTARGGVK
jgi:AcrR family transcriptional regulator